MKAERQTCPRRMTEFGPQERAEGLDTWLTGGGLVGQAEVGRSCSYCGSLDPDRFMELVRDGWVVGPTDKSYKAYLGKPVTDEDRAKRRTEWVDRLSPLGTEDRKALAALWEREHAQPMSSTEAKFYLQHLSEQERDEFIDLYNGKRMVVGYPGHFYVRPFFCNPVTESA